MAEKDVMARLTQLNKKGVLRRIGFSFDTRKLGLSSTLVACKIPRKKIARASKIISANTNVTHNYQRRHRFNMWFTLSAASREKLDAILAGMKNQLGADELISLPTKNVFKLRFRLNAK